MWRRHLALLLLALIGLAVLPQPAAAQEPSRLRIAIPGDDGSLTPYTFVSGYAFMSLVYDTLMWRDAKGIARPWLARSIDRNAFGDHLTVRLRQGIRWHDGTPLTARDVDFTYRYVRAHPHPRFTPELQDITDIDVHNDQQLTFTLRRPSLGFDDQPLADVPILPRHLWENLPRGRLAPRGLPVGSGPYKLTRYEPGRSYRFEANPDYFHGTPSIARIDAPVIRGEADIATDVRTGRIDAGPITVPPGSRLRPRPTVRLSGEAAYSGTMLLFNVAGRPFHRRTARRAVADALNLRAIAGNAGGVTGGPVPAERGMLHPESRWAKAGILHRFDPDAARLAFSEQGIDAFTVAATRNDPVRLEVAKRVVRALADAGARARLLELSPASFDRALGRRDERATFDIAVTGIPALASYDPAFLRAVFGDPRTAPLNDGGYRSAVFALLAERAAAAATQRARHAAVEDQLRFLARDLPAVPLLFGGGAIAYRPSSYDRWVDVRGTGILDKRSFLRGAAATNPDAPVATAPGDLIDTDDDRGFSLVPIIVALVVLLLGGGGWWLRQRT